MALKRRFRNGQLRRRLAEGSAETTPPIGEWSTQERVAGIRFQEPEVPFGGTEEEERDAQASTPENGAPQRSRGDGVIDLNTASFEALQEVPHLGPERAEQVIAMRPVTDLSQLRSIDGIGPKRLADIEAHGRLG